MQAFKIKNVKQFMSKLLASEAFDIFMLEEASISTYNTFIIDGHQNKDFYTTEEWEDREIRPYDFSTWKQVRPICYSLIKGTRTPSAFKFILHLVPEHVQTILEKGDTNVTSTQLKALVVTIKYDGTTLTLITGTSFHTFVMDKSIESLWDSAIKQFLNKREIEYEEL